MVFEVPINELDIEWLDSLESDDQLVLGQHISELLKDEPACKPKSLGEVLRFSYPMLVRNPFVYGEIVCFSAFQHLGQKSWELSSVVVNPKFRAQGVGLHWVCESVEFFKDGYDEAFGSLCVVSTPELVAFYGKCGFVAVSNTAELPSAFAHRAVEAQAAGRVLAVLEMS